MRRLVLICLLILSALPLLSAEDDAALKTRLIANLKGKTVALRGFYRGNRLEYDASGNLVGTPNPGIWSVDSYLTIESVGIKRQVIEIVGHRLFVTVDVPDPKVAAENCTHFTKPAIRYYPGDRVVIRIARFANDEEKQIGQTLIRMFYSAKDDMAADVPPFWRKFVRHVRMSPLEYSDEMAAACQRRKTAAANKGATEDGSLPDGETVYRIGENAKDLTAPISLYTPDPEYTDVARIMRWQGTCVFRLIVDSTGVPSEIEVDSPCGFGLDENSYKTLLTWRFKPSTLMGTPVPVKIGVEMSFHLE